MELRPEVERRMRPLRRLAGLPVDAPEARAAMAAYHDWAPGYRPPPVRCGRARAGAGGGVPLRWYRPPRRSRGQSGGRAALLWLHGGGFAGGSTDMAEADIAARELAWRADALVVSADYRLAGPGSYYPAPVEDVLAAYRWTADHAGPLGVDPHRIALGGASAGGNLACAAALRLRHRGPAGPGDAGRARRVPPPNRLLLAYPLVHARLPQLPRAERAAIAAAVPELMRNSQSTVDFVVACYLGRPTPADQVPAGAMPSRADLSGLPPTTVVTSEFDDLRGSGEDLAARLDAAGVPVRLVRERGVVHGHLNDDPRTAAVAHSLRVLAEGIG